jgi:hypothetical protein
MDKKKLTAGMIGLGLLILGMLVYYANPWLVWKASVDMNKWFVLGALVLASINTILRTVKWRVLLKGVRTMQLLPVQVLGMTISNFTPGKAGEPLKAVFLHRDRNIDMADGLASVVWERIMDLIVLIIFVIGFIVFMSLESSLVYLGIMASVVFSIGIIILLVVLFSKQIGRKIFNLLRKLPLLRRIDENFVENFQRSGTISKKRLLLCFIVTIVCWVFDGVIFYLVFAGMGFELTPLLMTGFIAFATLVGIASTLPGGLGGMEAVFALLLGIVGIGIAAATSGILIARFATFWYTAFLGAIAFFWLAKRGKLMQMKENRRR